MFSQSWSNNTEQPILFYYPQWHHHWWFVYLILCKLRDLPCYSTIKTSQQTDRGVDGTSDSPLTMFPVAVLLLLAAGSCESPWICHRVTTFSFAGQLEWFMTKHSSFNRCEVWTVDAASLCDCAARSTSDHQLPGLLFSQLLDSLDQTACRKRTGVDWDVKYGHQRSYYKDSLKNKFSIDLDTSSNTVTLKGQNMQPGDTAVYYCARDTQWYKPSADLNKKPLSAWTLVTWSHQRRSPKTTGDFRPAHLLL